MYSSYGISSMVSPNWFSFKDLLTSRPSRHSNRNISTKNAYWKNVAVLRGQEEVIEMDQEGQQGKTYAFFFSGADDERSRQMKEHAKANPGSLLAGAIEDIGYVNTGLHHLIAFSLLSPGTDKVTVVNFKAMFNNRKEQWTLDEGTVRHILTEYGFTAHPHTPDLYELRGPLQSKSLYSLLRGTQFDPTEVNQSAGPTY